MKATLPRVADTYLNYSGWGPGEDSRSHKAENLNAVTLPELDRLVKQKEPFLLFLRHMDPHSPYLPPGPSSGSSTTAMSVIRRTSRWSP